MDTPLIATLKLEMPNGTQEQINIVAGKSYKVGRNPACDIIIDDLGVSWAHAAFSASINGLMLIDLGSTNGTFVNTERITSPRDLTTGDIVNIGSSKFEVVLQASKVVDSLSASFSKRAMTAQLKPMPTTVAVVSIANYANMASTLPSYDLNSMVSSWTASVSATVQEYGGLIDKVVGTSIVAVWNGGSEREMAVRAAHGALEISQLPKQLVERIGWPYQQSHPWHCTIVLSSGLALTGNIGAGESTERHSFALLGDPLNIAFRLEELVGKLGEDLIVSEQTAKLIEDTFIVTKIIKVKIKGREQGIDTFTISA